MKEWIVEEIYGLFEMGEIYRFLSTTTQSTRAVEINIQSGVKYPNGSGERMTICYDACQCAVKADNSLMMPGGTCCRWDGGAGTMIVAGAGENGRFYFVAAGTRRVSRKEIKND